MENNINTNPSLKDKFAAMATWKKVVSALTAAAVLSIGWAAFRPETLIIDSTVDEAPPVVVMMESGESAPNRSGEFSGTKYETSGQAVVIQQGQGKGVVRFENFETQNGPDLKVVVVYQDGSRSTLGELKGSKGNQNYEVEKPDEVAEVLIWCKRFDVYFGTALIS